MIIQINKYIKYKADNLLILENLSNFLFSLLPGLLGAQLFFSDNGLEVDVVGNQVSGGKEMVVVDNLDEWLNFSLSLDFLGAHSPCDLKWVSLNACNESVWEFLILCTTTTVNKHSNNAVECLPSFHHHIASQ